jgi:hypothetical protein
MWPSVCDSTLPKICARVQAQGTHQNRSENEQHVDSMSWSGQPSTPGPQRQDTRQASHQDRHSAEIDEQHEPVKHGRNTKQTRKQMKHTKRRTSAASSWMPNLIQSRSATIASCRICVRKGRNRSRPEKTGQRESEDLRQKMATTGYNLRAESSASRGQKQVPIFTAHAIATLMEKKETVR